MLVSGRVLRSKVSSIRDWDAGHKTEGGDGKGDGGTPLEELAQGVFSRADEC